MVAVNKTWEELTSDEKNDLNCPEAERVNRRRRKTPEKKRFLFIKVSYDNITLRAVNIRVTAFDF